VSEGWKCPHCGSAHAPDVKTCPEAPLEIPRWLLERQRALPLGWPPAVPYDCGCPANHVCMSVACPRAVRITCEQRQ
jgi:hypothetical protein